MAVILFIDLLGARARWSAGGVPSSIAVLERFTRFMISAAREDLPHIIDGGIETDSAAFVCDHPFPALRIATRAFQRAWDAPTDRGGMRLWLRGAIVQDRGAVLRTERPASGAASQIRIVQYSREFFDAVAVEKSGFKGMRLLVRSEVLTIAQRRQLAIPIEAHAVVPFKRLRNSTYPKGPSEDLMDFLWMYGEAADDTWQSNQIAMSRRLRQSASHAEEFAQAAATQVVFHEADAILRTQKSHARRAAQRRDEQ
jgi:hypothetical protein